MRTVTTLVALGVLLSAGTALARPTGAGSLGRTIGEAVGNSANAINQTTSQTTRAATRSQTASTPTRRPAPQQANRAYAKPLPTNDPLEGTDAQTCQLDNGSSIRVSGGFRPSGEADCAD